MRRRHLLSLVAVLFMVGPVLTACSSAKRPVSPAATSSTATASSSTPTTAAALTASFRGVTATSIKIGIVAIDYSCIKQFVDYNFGNQPAIDQVFIDDLNAHGGVLGRKVVPVFKSYCPITNTQALTMCTSLTEDDQVFAVLGVIYDATGDAPLCLSRDHQTIHIGHELESRWISEAPPALLMTPDIAHDRLASVLLNLLKHEGTLNGKTVATLADQNSEPSIASAVKPALDAMGVAQGSPAILTITGSDTSAAQSQLDSFIEKWKSEGVNAIIMAGDNTPSKQFVVKIKAAMPNVLLLGDGVAAVLGGGQDAVQAKVKPNAYDGFLVASGLTDSEQWQSAGLQKCVQTYQARSGQTVIGPDQLQPGPDGKRAQVWAAVRDFCGELSLFSQIAERAGPDLTNTTWAQAANTFGEIRLAASVYASVHTRKYDADNSARLEAFDPALGSKGDFKPLTPIEDASK